jgi:hypothetical protein
MATEFQRGMRRAAQIALLYADENMRMCHDTILADPILMHARNEPMKDRAELNAAVKKAERLAIEGHGHSSRYHAGKDIAKLIREEAATVKPRKRK